jgi:hypothetical protein
MAAAGPAARRGYARVMSSARPAPRWHFLFTPKWLGWHAFVVFAVTGMLWLGEWQFHRAESGNALSWAYTFEWPVFAVFGVVFWGKTIYDEFRPSDPGVAPYVDLPAGAARPQVPGQPGTAVMLWEPQEADPDLDAYNAYLSQLNEQDHRG